MMRNVFYIFVLLWALMPVGFVPVGFAPVGFVPVGFAPEGLAQDSLEGLIVIEDDGSVEDLIVVEDEEDEAAKGPDWVSDALRFVDRYVFGEVGGYYAYGDSSERGFAVARVGLDYSFDTKDWGLPLGRGRGYVSGGYTYRSTELEIELEIHRQNASGGLIQDDEDNPRKETIKIEGEDSSFGLREGFFSYEPINGVTALVGRRKVVWGQFDLFSPVQIILPVEFQSKEFSYTKTGYIMPQDHVSVTWYPYRRLELSAYYFWSTILDPLLLDAFDTESANNTNNILSGSGMNTRAEGEPLPKADFEDYDAFATRAVWYADQFTLGFTYYNGRSHLFFEDLPLLQQVNDFTYNVIERVLLARASAYGLELSVPIGRWSWIFEFSYTQTQSSLNAESENFAYARRGLEERENNLASLPQEQRPIEERFLQMDRATLDKRVEYFEWVRDNNKGRFYAPVDNILVGFGFDAEYDQLVLNLALYLLIETFSDKLQDGLNRERAAYPDYYDSDRYSEEDIMPFPTGGVGWRFGRDREHVVGVVGGLLGPAVGGCCLLQRLVARQLQMERLCRDLPLCER